MPTTLQVLQSLLTVNYDVQIRIIQASQTAAQLFGKCLPLFPVVHCKSAFH